VRTKFKHAGKGLASDSTARALPPWATVPRNWFAIVWLVGAPLLLLLVARTTTVFAFVFAWSSIAVAIVGLMDFRAHRIRELLRHGALMHGTVSERASYLGKTPSVRLAIVYGSAGEHRVRITVPDRAAEPAWQPLAGLTVGDKVTLAVDPKDPSRAAVLAAR